MPTRLMTKHGGLDEQVVTATAPVGNAMDAVLQ
jgi:hypothetical protein